MTHQLPAAAFAVLAISASVACAVVPDESMFAINGFGTGGAERLSAVMQVVSQYQIDGTFAPNVERSLLDDSVRVLLQP